MTPKQIYYDAIKHHNFYPDTVQEKAVQLTETLYQQLVNPSSAYSLAHHSARNSEQAIDSSWLQSIKQNFLSTFFSKKKSAIKGLYFWGGVGQGKTWLIDSFFNTLPFPNKRRIHFHPFMHEIHEQLKILPKTPDPLPIIAKQMVEEIQLLCIDEFHVQDITDAMILGGLFKALYSEGLVLVITSNIAPDELYRNGLQRDSFLPAIKMIKHHSHIFELNNKVDYRTLVLEKEGCYHSPLNEYNRNMMSQHFLKISQHAPIHTQFVEINKRKIQVIAVNRSSKNHPNAVIWFEFNELCNTARSSVDFLWIAQHYPNILVSNIYKMNEEQNDIAKRFVHLIDALYDKHCALVISAEAEPDQLYRGRQLKISFPRTASRLKEMRSKLYRGKQEL
ncbi:MAG: cell division protein ZapE [Gammaproteobacteria bacterium]|nr:cell division protein ZapE [Gammaproteobacteria bacterium]